MSFSFESTTGNLFSFFYTFLYVGLENLDANINTYLGHSCQSNWIENVFKAGHLMNADKNISQFFFGVYVGRLDLLV